MKHSAAHTVMEQAADAGPIFKGMKFEVKQMDLPNVSISHIYHHIESELELLQNNLEGQIVRLPIHKKMQF